MPDDCPCTGVLKLQRKTDRYLSKQEKDLALMQATMQQHVKSLGESSLLIKECLDGLDEGAKVIRDIQESMRVHKKRLDEGDEEFEEVKEKMKSDSKSIKKDTKIIVFALVFIALLVQSAHPDVGVLSWALKLFPYFKGFFV